MHDAVGARPCDDELADRLAQLHGGIDVASKMDPSPDPRVGISYSLIMEIGGIIGEEMGKNRCDRRGVAGTPGRVARVIGRAK
jgi:hypothetical protein